MERTLATYEKGHFVKVEFPDELSGVSEWMWVHVHRCGDDRQIVFGVLENAPVNDSTGRLKLGTELAVSFSQIREHRKAADFLASVIVPSDGPFNTRETQRVDVQDSRQGHRS
jgi:hypothetical protein